MTTRAKELPSDEEHNSLPEVIVVGNLTIDDVVHPNGTTSMASLGGNSVYVSAAAAIWGVRVGVVARIGEDFPVAGLNRLRAAGVDTSGLRPISGRTVRNWVIYEDDGRRTWVYRTPPERSLEVAPHPEDLPTSWMRPDGAALVHVAAMPLPAAVRVIDSVRAARVQLVTLDTHEQWSSNLEALLAAATKVDVFLPSREELVTMLGYDDPERACEELVGRGVPAVVAKCGPDGAYFAASTGARGHVPAARVEVVDATGAGDSFCGGVIAGLALDDSLAEATYRASATAGAAIGASGSLRLLEGRAPIAVELLEKYRRQDAEVRTSSDHDEIDQRQIEVMR